MALKVITFGVCRQTIALLAHLLQLAIKGQIRGVAVCYWHFGEGRRVALTGIFGTEPERALSGADLIKVHAAHQLNLFAQIGRDKT